MAVTPKKELRYELMYSKNQINDIVQYIEKEKFDCLCKKGCPNYDKKWSCPPFSPSFDKYTSKYKYINIIVLTIFMNQFDYIKNDYLKLKAANSVLKSRIDKALRSCIDNDIYYISNGSCRLCKPCKCKLGQACAHPNLMSYSFESLGINVSDMVKDVLKFNLLWYRKGNLPEYTSVVSGILYKDDFDMNAIIKVLKKIK